ncbi:MAG: peptide ABC transporter substrate-binding protein [Candidatus Pacebacteria bacterium]|nr:peptide ABC transporter substrate-binding protein [Candidatus Paceibacterota bacterium]
MNSNPIPQDGDIKTDEEFTENIGTGNKQQTPVQKKPRAPRKKKIQNVIDVPEISPVVITPIDTSTTSISNIVPNTDTPTIETLPVKNIIETKKSSFLKLSEKIKLLYRSFRPTEKLIFSIALATLIFSSLSLLGKVNDLYSVELPTKGGTYTEGVIGYARFINPLLGYTDADRDMISLIYSGLLKPTPEGKLVADLAQSWTVSDDGLTYTFILKDGLTFHDGKPLTTDDIEFTVQKAQDPLIKSPRAENWAGVTMEKVSPTEIKFILKKPYSPFLENMTLGILPKHIWSNIEHEAFDINTYNREPIGSGPFKIKKAYRNDTGIYEYYDLVPFENYSLGAPYISHFFVKFYKGEDEALAAYKNGSVSALGGVSPADANALKMKKNSLISTPLPRVFGLFFNQSNAPVLVNKEVREALNASINRLSLIDSILQGWGAVSKNAIPRSLSHNQEISHDTTSSSSSNTPSDATNSTSTENTLINDQYIAAGRKILTDKGWKQNADGIFEKQTKSGKTTETQILRFTISTSNVPELKQSAEILRDTWTKLGADVKVEIFEPSDLTQKVIRPRKYDSLLFGNVVGRDLDLYPFWHSSQRNDPGLNIALYTNIKADKALETIRNTSDEVKKADAYKVFENEIQNDIPAVFLYSPDYIYATSKDIHNLEISNITNPAERFMDVQSWYIETEKVWKIFEKQKI